MLVRMSRSRSSAREGRGGEGGESRQESRQSAPLPPLCRPSAASLPPLCCVSPPTRSKSSASSCLYMAHPFCSSASLDSLPACGAPASDPLQGRGEREAGERRKRRGKGEGPSPASPPCAGRGGRLRLLQCRLSLRHELPLPTAERIRDGDLAEISPVRSRRPVDALALNLGESRRLLSAGLSLFAAPRGSCSASRAPRAAAPPAS